LDVFCMAHDIYHEVVYFVDILGGSRLNKSGL
jgi:mannose/fructose-specific phosphotransferase system component IIA